MTLKPWVTLQSDPWLSVLPSQVVWLCQQKIKPALLPLEKIRLQLNSRSTSPLAHFSPPVASARTFGLYDQVVLVVKKFLHQSFYEAACCQAPFFVLEIHVTPSFGI